MSLARRLSFIDIINVFDEETLFYRRPATPLRRRLYFIDVGDVFGEETLFYRV